MKTKTPAPIPAANNNVPDLEPIDVTQLADVSGGACPCGCGMANCNMRMGGMGRAIPAFGRR